MFEIKYSGEVPSVIGRNRDIAYEVLNMVGQANPGANFDLKLGSFWKVHKYQRCGCALCDDSNPGGMGKICLNYPTYDIVRRGIMDSNIFLFGAKKAISLFADTTSEPPGEFCERNLRKEPAADLKNYFIYDRRFVPNSIEDFLRESGFFSPAIESASTLKSLIIGRL